MVYAYRLNDQKDWVKMRNFESFEQYREYVERKNIMWSKCYDEKAFELYGSTATDPAPEGLDE